MELSEIFASYRAERPNLQPVSAREILCTIRLFERFLGRCSNLSDLSKPTILLFMSTFPGAYTSNKHRVNLICLWNHAEQIHLLPGPPKIKKRKEPLREPVCWYLEELQQLYKATDLFEGAWDGVPIRTAWKLALAILYDTGCRIGTLLKADLAEFRLSDGTWHCPAEHIKGRRADRVYQLHPDTCLLISQSLIKPRKKLWPFPFCQRLAYRHLGKLLDLAGLPKDRLHLFHCIRKTAESYAASNNGIEWAASCIGHSPAVAKKFYISKAICKPPSLIDGLPRIFGD